MHHIKAEYFLFHIVYVTQLFFLGHTTHIVTFRHIYEYNNKTIGIADPRPFDANCLYLSQKGLINVLDRNMSHPYINWLHVHQMVPVWIYWSYFAMKNPLINSGVKDPATQIKLINLEGHPTFMG